MRRHCFIIRHAGQSARLSLLRQQFRQLMAADYFIFQETFSDPDSVTQQISPDHWLIGYDYLVNNQLHAVKHTGWQCGDYMAYAARDLLVEYDYYWIMDDDVAINMPLDEFLGFTADLPQDCLACEFSPRQAQWMWYPSMAEAFPDAVYGMLYCLVRLSGRAIDCLKAQRIGLQPQGEGRAAYPNDEAFTGTILMDQGFDCADLKQLLPNIFLPYFSLTRPILLDELSAPHTQGKVLHPVCDAARCWQKISGRVNQRQFDSLRDRFYTCYLYLPESLLNDYYDQRFTELLSQAFGTQPLIKFSLLNLDFSQHKFPTLNRYWFYRSYILVLEFDSIWGRYAMDIQADHRLFIVPRDKRAKRNLQQSGIGRGGKQAIYDKDSWLFPQFTTSIFCEKQVIHLSNLSELIKHIDRAVSAPALGG